jgi:hypothetical protein
MKYFRLTGILTSLLLALVVTAGCDKGSAPPAPIAVEDLAPALDKAFAKATGDVKELAGQVSGELKTPDYPKAYFDLQALSGKSGLTKEQVSIVSRGLLCLNETLQAAQSNGDQKAAETLRQQRMTK